MNNQNIFSLIKENSKKLFILGVYRPEDFYFAHLLEHCLAVDLGKRNIIKVSHADIGGGYMFINGTVENVDKANNILDYISSFNVDPNSLNHQKKILIAEKLYKDRVYFNRGIYESLETNSSSLEVKESLYADFVSCEGKQLEEKIKTVFESIKGVILSEDFDQLALQKILNNLPKIQKNEFKFTQHKTSSDFVFAEIDIEIPSVNKTIDFIDCLVNERIFDKIQGAHILYGTHTVANSLAKTWNKRNLVQYSGYFPKEYSDEFFDTVIEEWRDTSLSTEDGESIKKLINDYINNRTIEESVMELLEYGSLIEKGWEQKVDLIADLSAVQSKLKIYKKTTALSRDEMATS